MNTDTEEAPLRMTCYRPRRTFGSNSSGAPAAWEITRGVGKCRRRS